MKNKSKITGLMLLKVFGTPVVLLALCFQLFAGSFLGNSGSSPDSDTVSFVIEKDAQNKIENPVILENSEFNLIIFRQTLTVSVALHLNKGLTNMFGRASVPHANQIRYILFQNQKLDCFI